MKTRLRYRSERAFALGGNGPAIGETMYSFCRILAATAHVKLWSHLAEENEATGDAKSPNHIEQNTNVRHWLLPRRSVFIVQIQGQGWCSDPQCRRAEAEERQAAKRALQQERAATGAGSRGPVRAQGSYREQRRDLQAERAEEGAGTRGPKPEEGSYREQRRHLQAERAEEAMGSRGPKPLATDIQKQGYPFPDEEGLSAEEAMAHYLAFTRSWCKFGLSRACERCGTLTTAKYYKQSKETGKMMCKTCRENATKILLPDLPPVPLQDLQPIEQHLIAMARISQVLLDKLPAGGPSAQWGRMYAVLMDEPLICDVLDGATLQEDGKVLVDGVQGLLATPARLDCLHKALAELKANHRLYKANPAVDQILARMAAILQDSSLTSADALGKESGAFVGEEEPAATEASTVLVSEEQQGQLEMTYLVPKHFKAANPETAELQKARGMSALGDDMDVKFFPHLFPTGTGGWQDQYGSFSQYARKHLLGLDPRFESSAAYIMWLLEMHMKKRLTGNINVRIGGQQASHGKTKYQEGRSQIFTALRDIPGTHPYVYAKKQVAMNMYEQLGTPKFFMTLSCNARQPDMLIAVISARLLRLHPFHPPEELELQAAQILFQYQNDETFKWDGLSPNQLCKQHPAIVARQFMHQLTQLMWWLSAERDGESHLNKEADPQDEPQHQACGEDDEDFVQAPATGRHRGVRKERPPFKVLDYIIRIEWQKRGYPHAHILLWVADWATSKRPPGDKDEEKAKDIPKDEHEQKGNEAPEQVPDWSDEEAMENFVPKCAEVGGAQHTEYCGIKAYGVCRHGFPHGKEERTRRRSSQEKYANSRFKSSLATRRTEFDTMMGQYNIKILRRWRASMDLQVICQLTSASRYILGYAMKSEQDKEAQQRVESIVINLTSGSNKEAGMGKQQVYKAAHAALQGRTTSTFEACHLLLGFPIVEFSRDSQYIQVGPPETWTLSVPKQEEGMALQRPDSYRSSKLHKDGFMHIAQQRYREMQLAFGEQEVDIPVEGGGLARCRFADMIFLDFCAAFKIIGVKFPQPRKRPAIVAYRNFSPDLEPEAFYFSRLLLYSVWKEPVDWLREEDAGSHAAAFRRLANDVEGHPDFLKAKCFPHMDGTLEAARKLQAVQATMYMKAKIHPAHLRDGWANSKVAQDNYEDSLKVLEALKERHSDEIDFTAPDDVPTGADADAFAPVEEGPESFDKLTVENPSPETKHQRHAMEHIIQEVLSRPNTKDGSNPERLHMLLHGPGGCGKSVVIRAAAHMLRQGGVGVVIAAPTGVAAWNINGVTLHACCLLPVVNKSYGKPGDLPPPSGPLLATLPSMWRLVSALFVDEMSFISSFMLERLDQHLRLARDTPNLPFGGVHIVFAGDLYQLPPPGGHPLFKSQLWLLFRLCELRGNQRAAKDPEWAALLARVRVGKCTEKDIKELRDMVVKPSSSKQPAPKAVHLYATRRAVAESNRTYFEEHVSRTNADIYESPALDVNVRTGAPLSPEVVWPDPENTGGLEALVRVAVGVRVMLRHNIDVQDGLVNGACGFVEQVDADEETGEIEKIWVAFEKNAGAKWRAEHETAFVAISRRSATYLDMDGNKASRLQFPIVLAKATTIHKSQAATLHDGAHCRLDATCSQEGQAYVALSRCPSQALCSLEFFNPKSLRFNANAEWALTKLKAQQAGQDGSELWKQLFRPEKNKDFYEARLAEMGAPDWSLLKDGTEEVEPPWRCPDCGEAASNNPLAIKAHKRQCIARPAPKARSKRKARAKSTANTKPAAKATAQIGTGLWIGTGLCGKRPSAESFQRPPPPKLPRTDAPGRSNLTPNSSQPEYFERQDALRCGIHALNNALGFHFIDARDMTRAADAFLFENQELYDNVQDHVAPEGDYSIEVMSMVLRTKAMEVFGQLRWEMDIQRAMTVRDLEGCVGAVQHRHSHWVALRRTGEDFRYLDSLEAQPRDLTAGQLEEILSSHPTYGVRLL
ncbi:pfh1 [Symbiodinium sp. KB8]|nr:pfh1 [Symbiodinium sp. KB8]